MQLKLKYDTITNIFTFIRRKKGGIKVASIFDLFKKIESKGSFQTGPCEYIIAGLGNPGAQYSHTRHNVGFEAIDALCNDLGVECGTSKFRSLCAVSDIEGKKVLIMKPQTYMNLSGEAVGEAASFYKIPPEKIIVFCDDVNFDTGVMRIREKGSDAGQRGIRSITEHLSSQNFPRVRIGVGKKPHPEYDLKDWVLGKPVGEDLENIKKCTQSAPDICRLFISGRTADAMGKYNCKR